jgi:hypothetical protein
METKLETGKKQKAPLSVELETGPIIPMETKVPFLMTFVSTVLLKETSLHRVETHRTFGTHRPRTRARE